MTLLLWAPQVDPGSTAPALHLISLLLVVYVYDAAVDNFKVIPDMFVGTTTWIHNAQKALHRIESGTAFCSCCLTCYHVHSLTVTYMWLRCNAVDLCCGWRAYRLRTATQQSNAVGHVSAHHTAKRRRTK